MTSTRLNPPGGEPTSTSLRAGPAASSRRRLRDLKQVPVAPSLITLGNLCLGFLAMAKVTDAVGVAQADAVARAMTPELVQTFEAAALLIVLAMVFDALDGRVARMTGQTSQFGAQLDSLADIITFGLAPAFVAKVMINLHDGLPVELLPAHPKIYYVVAAIYVSCAAMRLARFNVETGDEASDHEAFRGLPTPGAAAFVVAIIAFICTRDDTNNIITRALLPADIHDWLIMALPATLVCLGLMMVSRLPYPHMFFTLMRKGRSFPFLATLVVLIGLAMVEWQLAALVVTLVYVLSGFVVGCYHLLTRGGVEPPDPGAGPSVREPGLN